MIVIIMAGGLGKRMESNLPKVLHKVSHPINHQIQYPMLIHVILTSIKLKPKKIFIIVGKFRETISNEIYKYIFDGTITDFELIEYVEQEVPSGTGHAIKCTLEQIKKYSDEKALILSGDVPLISSHTLENLIEGNTNKLLITELSNPFGCGRILVDSNNKIIGIREEKDCTEEEKYIRFVNCGIYQILVRDLLNLIPQISNNNKSQEYYLTDIVDLMIKNNIPIETHILNLASQWEIKNVNTKKDLEELNNFINLLSN
jgi:bifunctional N-acetylglucosamine-1-phosphate-uridyltransferase/glucosamine-1-phosphate-acetyltransferase GlmU-like protein